MYCRKTAAGVVKLLREYPYAKVRVSGRAALAMYETMASLILVGADNPELSAALITLTHRISSDSVLDNEKIVREVVEEYLNPGAGLKHIDQNSEALPRSKVTQILKELDNLQDMIHAMPYEIDMFSPSWFKISRDTLFRPEAPTLLSLTMKNGKDPDYSIYENLINSLITKGLVRLENGSVTLTRQGAAARFRNVFNMIEQKHLSAVREKRRNDPISSDSRKYRRSDSYKSLHLRKTLRNIIKKKKDHKSISNDDLRVKETSFNREFQLAIAIDHSWSMGRNRKLQSAKEAAAGLAFAARRNGDRLALIGFSDYASICSPLSNKYSDLIYKVNHFRPEAETNIADALLKARIVFSRSRFDGVKHLIIISDGIPTIQTGFEEDRNLSETISREIKKMRNMGITISVICIRDELEENDSSQARKIATMGKGAFRMVNAAELMRQTLEDYAGLRQ